ncbi:MAG: tRNA pseudouridine(38-40) synthase TruA [Clostridia bacterium]|nr:tRNA pseudouridine(38-40) synthase TruA [Clostridia bacterium]
MESGLQRFAVNITFDGADYCGWQVQDNAKSVQETLQDALEKTFGLRPDVHGCSRTDSGVHAKNYVCHFDLPSGIISESKLPLALNSGLKNTKIAAKYALAVTDGFHARYSAVKKEYLYRIWNSHFQNPLLNGKVLFFPQKIDEKKLKFVSSEFLGKHDFAAFMSKSSKITDDTVREIYRFDIERHGDEIDIFVCADGFLYNMVRIMVGTLLSASYGNVKEGGITEIINSRDRKNAGDTAPSHALYLNRIFYDEKTNKSLHCAE